MFDDKFDFDFNFDGTPDVELEGIDVDGDGSADLWMVDMNNDGMSEMLVYDSNGNGIVDSVAFNGIDYIDDPVAPDTDADSYEPDTQYEDTDDIFDFDNQDEDTDEFDFTSHDEGDDEFEFGFDEGDGEDDEFSEYDVDDDVDDDTDDIFDFGFDESADDNDSEHTDYDDDDGKLYGNPDNSDDYWEYQQDTNRCAIYSQKFVIEELTGEELDIEELADLSEENGWFTEECGTEQRYMNKILDHYGIENEMTSGNTMNDIEECLDNGGKVIVAIDSGEVWFGEEDSLYLPGDGVDHAVEVIGVDHTDPDNPVVILNDSGHPEGQGMRVPLDVFEDAWEDGNNYMIACE